MNDRQCERQTSFLLETTTTTSWRRRWSQDFVPAGNNNNNELEETAVIRLRSCWQQKQQQAGGEGGHKTLILLAQHLTNEYAKFAVLSEPKDNTAEVSMNPLANLQCERQKYQLHHHQPYGIVSIQQRCQQRQLRPLQRIDKSMVTI